MFCLFFLPSGIRWRRAQTHSSSVGTGFSLTQAAGEAPRVSEVGAHSDSPLLASAPLVCRPPSPVAGSSGGSAPPPRPPAPASVSLPLPGSPKASASCLETLRRFTRAADFSSTVAAQAFLSRRPSSRKAYQLKWQLFRQNTYLQNKKHMLTCQGWDWLL